MPERDPFWPASGIWLEYLAAILAGNAIYFLLVEPFLPPSLQHVPFRVDAGLGIDFLVCAGVLLLIRGWRRRRTTRHTQAM